MKQRLETVIVLLSLGLAGCGPAVPISTEVKQEVEERDTMNINVNGQVASIQLEDNATTKALVAEAPFTIQMDDLHRNEKYHYFGKSFPTQPQAIQTIEAGDVLLYQNNCLVIFYQAGCSVYADWKNPSFSGYPGVVRKQVGFRPMV